MVPTLLPRGPLLRNQRLKLRRDGLNLIRTISAMSASYSKTSCSTPLANG
ncbi:hypothetical protein [Kribbella deserti]|uniref:Uncharacterized protein n=1 Tax=Kribbella deserti TaxID=1926257 RepID=A0ABV6QID5_9ACTN